VIATTGGLGRFGARPANAVDPELVQQMIALRSSVFGDFAARRPLFASPTVASGSARCALSTPAIGRVHARPPRRSGSWSRPPRPENLPAADFSADSHDGISALIDRGSGDVGDLGAGRHRRLDHRFPAFGLRPPPACRARRASRVICFCRPRHPFPAAARRRGSPRGDHQRRRRPR